MIPDRAIQTMCPEFQQLLIDFATELDTQTDPSVAQLRQRYREQVLSFNGPIDKTVAIDDMNIDGRDGTNITLRLFAPPNADGPSPVCLFFHGGGWVVGDLDTHTGICADIAKLTGAKVIAVDYRLSPESVFPAALHDCIDALHYVVNHAEALAVNKNKISLMGDSAGANLCAAVAMACRNNESDADIKIATQVLIYPSLGADNNLPSFDENEDIPGLSREDMTYYFQSYIGGKILPNTLAAPLSANSFLRLPKSYISVAEFDPLRDDGIEYASKLRQAGVSVSVSTEKGLGHSWLWVRNRSSIAQHAFLQACQYLKASNL